MVFVFLRYFILKHFKLSHEQELIGKLPVRVCSQTQRNFLCVLLGLPRACHGNSGTVEPDCLEDLGRRS